MKPFVQTDTYLIAHFGTGMDVKAQVVVGQLGGLFLQLPGESDLPAARKTHTPVWKAEAAHSEITHAHLVWPYHCSAVYFKNQMVNNHICIVTWPLIISTRWFTVGSVFLCMTAGSKRFAYSWLRYKCMHELKVSQTNESPEPKCFLEPE